MSFTSSSGAKLLNGMDGTCFKLQANERHESTFNLGGVPIIVSVLLVKNIECASLFLFCCWISGFALSMLLNCSC